MLKHATINFAMSILPPPVFYPEMSLFYPINERVNTPKPLILQTSSGHEREMESIPIIVRLSLFFGKST